MDFQVLLADAAELQPSPTAALLQLALPFGLMIVLFYFILLRPEKKRKERMTEMLSSIQIADEVVTSGGIIGRVIDSKPDSEAIVIETGGDKTRIRVLKSHIIENRTVHDDV
ncbi:MAG: preprotein translocase subunit YajC [Oscillospiraceae bacterium]|nr:preprotein translocase subunit YajC [Oscillospiraceae bacterium]